MKNNTYAASLSGYIHTTSNQLDAINKEQLPKPGLLKTLLLKMHHCSWKTRNSFGSLGLYVQFSWQYQYYGG